MITRVNFLKLLDRVFGGLAVAVMRVIPPRKSASHSHPASALFIRPGGIGDAVLLVPSILAFRRKYPGVKITVLAERRNASVFKLCTAVDTILIYDRPKELLAALRGAYDVVIDTEQWHRLSAAVASLTRASVAIGYATNERRRLFTFAIPYYQDDYEVDSFFRLLNPFGVARPPENDAPYLSIPGDSAKKGEEHLGRYAKRPFAVLFPGASIQERRWGVHNFRRLAEWLHAKGIAVVVIGGKEDAVDGEGIAACGCGLNLAGKTSLIETAAVVDRAALLVSGDSGILHIAVGLGKPTVSLFGPGVAKKWAPRSFQHIVINKHLPCSPCTRFGYTPKCPLNAKCMADITIDEVAAAIEKLLGANRV